MESNQKKKDAGKIFEQDVRASIPSDYFVERYKDDTAGFRGVSNPADFRIYRLPYTHLWELKTHKGKSLPLDKIRGSQLKEMRKAAAHIGVHCGFLINYRELEETYYIRFEDLVEEFYLFTASGEYEVKSEGRKSIPVSWCRTIGVRIPQTKKITRYSYDLREVLEWE